MHGFNFEKLKLDNYKPLREIVFEHLRASIINGQLKPGERLMELQLADQLGVSRTPIREAIRKLELEGLVEMVPRKGAYVADLSIKDVLDVLEVRAYLEGLAARLAAERMVEDDIEELEFILHKFQESLKEGNTDKLIDLDNAFHEKIIKGSYNNKLIQIVQGLHEQVLRFRVMYFTETTSMDEVMEYHRAIFDAISNRNPDKAQHYAETHVEMIKEAILSWKNKFKK